MFSKGSASSVKVVFSTFNRFSVGCGLVANLSKSCSYFAGVSDPVKRAVLEQLNMNVGLLSCRYLGFPCFLANLAGWTLECKCSVDKISRKLNRWTTKLLYCAMELIRSMMVLRTFVFRCFVCLKF